MKMKKFINDPANLTPELLEGFALANGDLVRLEANNTVVNKGLDHADRVTIVTQGGSGHEPAISGFVGEGMVDVSVVGDVFAAPGPAACVDAIKMADKGHGVLYIVLNHAGDMLTGNLTMKQLKKEPGVKCIKAVSYTHLDVYKRQVSDFYEVMKGNGDIDADTEYDINDYIDTSIYEDALKALIERGDDKEIYEKLLVEFEANNR